MRKQEQWLTSNEYKVQETGMLPLDYNMFVSSWRYYRGRKVTQILSPLFCDLPDGETMIITHDFREIPQITIIASEPIPPECMDRYKEQHHRPAPET